MNFEFDALNQAQNYQRALIGTFAPHLRGKVMEIGSGIGQMARHLSKLPNVRLECVEPDPAFCAEFRKRLPNLSLTQGTIGDIVSKDWEGIVNINVLEHIGADEAELKAYHDHLIAKNGVLCLFVPARPELHAPIDTAFGHYRRYRKQDLIAKVRAAGFEIEQAYYYDLIGYFGWWFNFCFLKRLSFDLSSVRFYDRMIFPWSSFLERHIAHPPIGKNVLIIARAK
jgi:SAM-dependent methyltransferase